MIIDHEGKRPQIHPTTYVAPSARVIGTVKIGHHSSVWPGAILRGDRGPIKIGHHSNIQDNCILHAREGDQVQIGNWVSVGHGATIHGAHVGDCVIIGMGAIILDKIKVGSRVLIGAGSVVTRNVPGQRLVLGVPARVVRRLQPAEIEELKRNALGYAQLAQTYLKSGEG
jgi:carbonic anhydrase/acetyltransferase-like protein (isoleucine patch superfamily)